MSERENGSRNGVGRRALGLLGVLAVLAAPACDAGERAGVRPTDAQAPATGTPAPDFSLTDQFGRPQRLSDLRGRLVLLTFVDSRCTTLCPLTAQLMTETKARLGTADPVQLVAIDANPEFTSVADVYRWSRRHRMLTRWLFLTGPLPELRAVWDSYGVQVKIVHGDVAHTALVYLIDPAGHLRAVFPIAQRRGIDEEASSIATAIDEALAT